MTEAPHRPSHDIFERALWILFALAFAHALFVLAIGINQPLVDLHSFRQTQTALSAYWLAKDGFRLDYQTPVVGWPWSIPFEFPLFQYLAGLLSRLGLPLDASGRLLSFAFFLASLVPLYVLYRRLHIERTAYLITGIIFLTCPLYLYWGRAFMIETCAVFFGLIWLAFVAAFVESNRLVLAVAALVAGSLAVLVKATTFPAFALLGGIIVATQFARPDTRSYRLLSIAAAFGLGPFVIGYAWVRYSDFVKSRNAIGKLLTSDALSGWNFGAVSQKLGSHLWIDIIWDRVLPDIFGAASVLAVLVIGASLTSRRHMILSLCCIAAFCVPFMMFTNLHIVHNYYQTANAIFLIGTVGISMSRFREITHCIVTLALICGIIIGQMTMFYWKFYPEMLADGSTRSNMLVGRVAAHLTKPDESLLVLGDDWSSMVAYYSQRKSITLAPWIAEPLVKKLFANPQSFLGDVPLGGIVYCSERAAAYNALQPLIDAFLANRKQLGEAGTCRLYAANKK